jgi:hypothetical protein
MENCKIYDMVKLSKTRVMVITMHSGVRVYMIDLKKKIKYEVSWFADTQKIRLMPGFCYKKRPLALTVKYDQTTLRNL